MLRNFSSSSGSASATWSYNKMQFCFTLYVLYTVGGEGLLTNLEVCIHGEAVDDYEWHVHLFEVG